MPTVNSQIQYLGNAASAAFEAVESSARELAGVGRLPTWGVLVDTTVVDNRNRVQVSEPTIPAFIAPLGLRKHGNAEAMLNGLIAPILAGGSLDSVKADVRKLVSRLIASDDTLRKALALVRPVGVRASSRVFGVVNARVNNTKMMAAVSVAAGVGSVSVYSAKAAVELDSLAYRVDLAGRINSAEYAAIERMVSSVAKIAGTIVGSFEVADGHNAMLYESSVASYIQAVDNAQRKVSLDAAVVSDNVSNVRAKVEADISAARTRIRATSSAAGAMAEVAAAALSAQTAILGAIGSAT